MAPLGSITNELDKTVFNYIGNYANGFKLGPTNGKSILRPWNFAVEFQNSHTFDRIRPHHILDVTIPTYKYKREKAMYGTIPKSFALFDRDQNLSFDITLEDDEIGSVTHLMYHIQQQHILKSNGVYLALNNQNLGNVWITLYDKDMAPLCQWTMTNVYFLGADDTSLSYSATDSLKVKFSFGCDIIKYATSEHSYNTVEDTSAETWSATQDRRANDSKKYKSILTNMYS